MTHHFNENLLSELYIDYLGYPVNNFFLAAGFLVAQSCFKSFER